MSIEDRIGVSTISLVNITAEAAADAMWERGFRAIEIFTGVPGLGSYGHPAPLPGAGIWPRACDDARRRTLREKLKRFPYVTVHAQFADNNIASLNPGIRQESAQQYFECIDFAHEIGAPLVTFHAGSCVKSSYPGVFEGRGDDWNIEFAREATDSAERHGLKTGFEGTHYAGMDVSRIVEKAGDPRFGLLVDIMQSYLTTTPRMEPLLAGIERCRGNIPELHLHGGLHRSIGRISHLPLRMHNMVDFRAVFAKLLEVGFDGPMMFEITSSDDPMVVIEDCWDSRRIVLEHLRALGA